METGYPFVNGAGAIVYLHAKKKNKEEEEEETTTPYTKLNSKWIINPEMLLVGIYRREIFSTFTKRHVCK